MPPPLPLLRVLGTPVLHGPDGEPIAFRTRKHFALLIYLALEPHTHRREKLAALLWPRATTSEARHSLSTALSVLRARLGADKVETTRDTARLLPGSLELDLDRLARGEIHATDTTAALDIEPLLYDFPVTDAIPWEQWRDGLAAKWQPAIREALLARIDRVRRQGNTRAMEVLADALLTLDDLSEDGVRAKMESRAFAGDRLTALQIYEDWRVRLADELGAQPSDLVAGMALRLRRRGWERTSGEHIPSVRTDQWKDRPFVGRAKEYEVLYEGWEGCERGTARHVLITGESGIGKSTLMERLATAAGLQGAIAARVQCHAVEREIPYGAIGSLIGMLLDRPGATAVSPEWLSELSRMVSAVRRRFPNVAAPPEATGEMVRIRLVDAFHELVRAIAEEQPLILIMDDIHLGDDASVAVMHLLLRRLTDERILVLCTLRQGDGPIGPSARGMFDRAELARMSVLPLPPLTDAESTELLGQLVPDDVQPPPATVRRALLRAGGGLPMLLELLVRDWMSHGDRCVALAVQAMTEEPGAAGGAGETYRRLLERLTLDLDPNTRSVLNLAAILGSQLNEFELYSLVDLTLAQAMTGLSQLASDRIMRDSGHGLEFVNEVMRGEVYLAVPSSVRKVLHSKVADRLIQRSKAGEEMLGLAIAWHCIRSGRVMEGGEWLLVGGEEALARSALAEAEEALESGYRHLPQRYRAQCAGGLAEVLLDQGRFEAAGALIRSPDAILNEPHSPRQEGVRRLVEFAARIGQPVVDEVALKGCLDILRTHPEPGTRLRAATLAVSLVSVVNDGNGYSLVLEELSAAVAAASPAHRARLHLLRVQVLFYMGEITEAESLLTSSLTAPDRDGPSLHRFNHPHGRALCRVARGDYQTSAALNEEAIQLAVKAGAPSKELIACSNLAVVAFRLGDLQLSVRSATRVRRLGAWPDAAVASAVSLGVLACSHAMLGDLASLDESMKGARHFLDTSKSANGRMILRLWIADALWLVGKRDEALRQAALGFKKELPFHSSLLGMACRWAALLHKALPRQEYIEILERGKDEIDRVHALDSLEIALSWLYHCRDDAENLESMGKIAVNASRGLPASAVTQLGRYELPIGQLRALA